MFALLMFVAAAVFGFGILGFGSEDEATATPSMESTQGPSGTPGSSETPTLTGTTTIMPPSPTPLVGGTPLALQVHPALDVRVQTAAGEGLGQMNGIVVSLNAGSSSYLVLQRADGSYGLVPWQAMDSAAPESSQLLTSLEPQVFGGAPSYDPTQMPDLITDPTWDAEAHAYWSAYIVLPENVLGPEDPDQVIAASLNGIVGMAVFSAEGTAVGHVVSVVVDLETGMPSYAAIELTGEAIEGNGTVLAPWERIGGATVDPPSMILAASVEALAQAPKVELGDWPEWLIDPDWDLTIREYWSSLNSG